EVPLSMQAKLLRVLQEREIERIGDTRSRPVNVRIVAATNRDLAAEVKAGRFRQDLFYRLNVFPINLPPLRERREDIPLLAEHFLRLSLKNLRRGQRAQTKLTEPILQQLTAYDWPGNIRELQNTIERAVIVANGGPIRFDMLPAPNFASTSLHFPAPAAVMTRDELKLRERNAIIAALAQTGGKVSGPNGAAEVLGMKTTTLYSRIAALGLERKPAPAA
ncbi:MAG TPA: sigma 54-interacting transcriptional regulator, partial [Chthoniobacterales bacterium]